MVPWWYYLLAVPGVVTLTWNAPADRRDDGSPGKTVEYDIRYDTSPIDSTTVDLAFRCTDVPCPDTTDTHQIYTVRGLEAGTVYYFVLRTMDDHGNWSGWSNQVSRVAMEPQAMFTVPLTGRGR